MNTGIQLNIIVKFNFLFKMITLKPTLEDAKYSTLQNSAIFFCLLHTVISRSSYIKPN